MLLPYENQMFLDLVSSDGLLIAAKGLGLEHVLQAMINVYSDPGNLVLVLGCNDLEEEYIRAALEAESADPSCSESAPKVLPKKVTSDYSSADRKRLYREGGVLFITTRNTQIRLLTIISSLVSGNVSLSPCRILVVDLLTDRIPADLITGILLTRAHKTVESCQDLFILRLFRQKNKKGFIKAFSSAPGAFKDIDRAMRNLFLANLFLWPRFHVDVNAALSECSPEVIEIHLQMTPDMKAIQTAVLDLINFTLQELKRLNPSLESYDEINLENALSRTFHNVLQRELDPIWHQLSWKTKQLVSDLKTLRTVLQYLTQYDCVTFYTFVSALRTTENAMRSGGWMILDAAETLFLTARQRLFGKSGESIPPRRSDIQAEENPKWSALDEILREIRTDNPANEKVLVFTADERTAAQLKSFLSVGPKALIERMFNKSLGDQYGQIPNAGDDGAPVKQLKHKGRGKKSSLGSGPPPAGESEPDSHAVLVQSLQVGSFEVYKMLEDSKPRYIVLYDVEMSAVRQIEIFQAKSAAALGKIRVYFLMYEKSVEEQAYLTSLRKEKEAFEKLIEQKATLAHPKDREGRSGENPDLVRDLGKKASDVAAHSKPTESGRGEAAALQASGCPKVIVDMREFRSELPSLIHKRGIDIEPVTIEVGDYILTPDICIERKSISDLIGSLQCGRLYNQATAMMRFYAKPMLLIEFDSNKPFALQGKYYLSRDIASTDITTRLQLLTIHFPKLRILWSPSPHATAELFEELKKGREEPSAEQAMGMSFDFVDDYNVEKYNPSVRDFLSKLPGITSKNVYAILNRVESLPELLEYTCDELCDVLSSRQNGEALYASLHEKTEMSSSAAPSASGAMKRKDKGPRFKSSNKRAKKSS